MAAIIEVATPGCAMSTLRILGDSGDALYFRVSGEHGCDSYTGTGITPS